MPATSQQEMEAKFVVHSVALGSTVRTASILNKHYSLAPATTITHLDLYLDTPDYWLLRHGYALRLRQTPDGFLVTLKGLNADHKSTLHKRLELEEPLVAAANLSTWEKWPQPLRDFLSNRLPPGEKVGPICAIRQTRHKRTVALTKADEPFGELSVDEVQLLNVDGIAKDAIWALAWQETPVLSTWCELEIELLPGRDASVLEALNAGLSKRRGLRPIQTSKFERALVRTHSSLTVAGQSIDQLVPELPMGDACRLIWRQQLAQLVLNEAGVRSNDNTEYIHDMRVAVRRMRTALRLFGRFFRPKVIRPFRRALRTTGRLLGAVRDRDVALERLAKHVRKDKNGQRADFELLAKTWQGKREQAFGKLIAWLDSDNYRRFVAQFARFCTRVGKGLRRLDNNGEGAQPPHQVRHVLPAVFIKQYSQVRAFESFFITGDSLSPQTLHQLRIQCKFLRYTLEFAQPLLGAGGKRLIAALKQLQDLLGHLNDAAVSQLLLAQETPTETETGVEGYRATQQAIIDRLQIEVASALAGFVSPATRRLVAQAVMRM